MALLQHVMYDVIMNKETQGIRLLQQLLNSGHRIFSMNDAIAVASLEKIPSNQLRKILSNLAKQGLVIRLRRGLYVSIGLLSDAGQTHPFVISSFLIQPSVISHWSALQYHGLTEQIPNTIMASTTSSVITPSMRKNAPSQSERKHCWKIQDLRYEYIHMQKKHFFGHEKIWVTPHEQVSITNKERTVLDTFIDPKLFGGIGGAMEILENALAIIDISKLVAYALQYGNKSLTKRLGWALESLDIEEHYFEPLLDVPIHSFCRLDPSKPAKGKYNKRWMIQDNLLGEVQ